MESLIFVQAIYRVYADAKNQTDTEADIVVVTVNAEAIRDVAIECCEHD